MALYNSAYHLMTCVENIGPCPNSRGGEWLRVRWGLDAKTLPKAEVSTDYLPNCPLHQAGSPELYWATIISQGTAVLNLLE